MEMYNSHGDSYEEVVSLLRTAVGSSQLKKSQSRRSDSLTNEALVAMPISPSNSKEEWLINDMPAARKKRKIPHEFLSVSRKRSCDDITDEGEYPDYNNYNEGIFPREQVTRDYFDDVVASSLVQNDTMVGSSKQLNCIRVMVKVEGHTFLVPCDPSSTIGWLCSVVAQRYAALDGRHPQLSLTNQKGALLANEDLVLAVINNEECVDARVISWTTPPLLDIYSNTSGGDANYLVVQKLKNISSQSHTINLSNCSIRASHFVTIVKCLTHQSSLTTLCLRGNRFGYCYNVSNVCYHVIL